MSEAQSQLRLAAIEIEAPASQTFPLRAVIPIDKGFYVPGEFAPGELLPFAILTQRGQVYDAQCSPVSFYPNRAVDGARTIEIVVSRFTRPPGVSPGERFAVYLVPRRHERGRLEPVAEVVQLLNSQPGELYLSSRDVFGHEYRFDIIEHLLAGSGQILDNGSERMRLAVRGVMKPVSPVGGSSGTLPRLFGVTLFLTFYPDAVVEIGMQLHNGVINRDNATNLDDTLRELNFRDLRLKLPQRWNVVHPWQSPNYGAVSGSPGEYHLIRPLAAGKMHYFSFAAQTVYRFAIHHRGAPRLRQLAADVIQYRTNGFASSSGNVPWSWESLGFGPAHTKVPSFSHLNLAGERAAIANTFESYETLLASGGVGNQLYSGQLGWANPWGRQYGGETGGVGIEPVPGMQVLIAKSSRGLLLEMLRSTLNAQRQPAVFVKLDGTPLTPEDFLVNTPMGQALPFLFNDWRVTSGHNPFQLPSNSPQSNYVASQGLTAPYKDQLLAYQPHDVQHLTRYTSSLMALALLANDPIAKEQLRQTAYAYALSFHPYLDVDHWTTPSDWGLRSVLAYAGIVPHHLQSSHPGYGLNVGRETAWGVMAQVMSATLGSQRDFDYFYPRFELLGLALVDGQNPHGLIMRRTIVNHLSNNYKILQVFEEMFLSTLAMSLRNAVFDGKDSMLQDQMCHVVAGQTRGILTYNWDTSVSRPRMVVGVANNSSSAAPFEQLPIGAYYQGDYDLDIYFPSIVAYGMRCSRLEQERAFFMARLSQAFGQNLKHVFEGFGASWIAMRAPALELFQSGIE